MQDNMGIPPLEEPKKDNKKMIIIVVVAIVVLCCCCASIGSGVYLWNNGDSLFGISSLLPLV